MCIADFLRTNNGVVRIVNEADIFGSRGNFDCASVRKSDRPTDTGAKTACMWLSLLFAGKLSVYIAKPFSAVRCETVYTALKYERFCGALLYNASVHYLPNIKMAFTCKINLIIRKISNSRYKFLL